MRRVDSRIVGLAIGLMAFALLTSGCFQTAGASLDATPTGVSAPPQPQVTDTPVIVPTDAPTLSQQVAQQPTEVPTTEQSPAVTETTIVAPTNVLPTGIPTDIPTNTDVPTVIQPTDVPTAIPTETLAPTTTPVVVAQVETAVLPSNDALGGLQATQTAVQAILFAQATQILANATATAGANQTGTSVALGTPLVQPTNTEGAAGAITNTPNAALATPTPSGPLTIVTGTPQGTPGEAGSGAAGPVTGDCIYTVIDGDRLLRIALRFGTNTSTLAKLNGIVNADMIVPGQRLHIPNCNGTPTPGPTSTLTLTPMPGATATPSANHGTYTVVQGDTLFGISTRYGVPIATIAQANGIANINLIYIGQQLNIP